MKCVTSACAWPWPAGKAAKARATRPGSGQRQVALDQHADHAQRVAAQRKRVLVAGGQLADAEQARQRLQLVGQRDHEPDFAARQRVAGKTRLVVVFHRQRDGFALAVVARVVAAHDALQFGELAHHVGQQVGLGQQRGAVGLLGQRAAAQLRPMPRAICAHTLDALALLPSLPW
jgi:hypothetical protein